MFKNKLQNNKRLLLVLLFLFYSSCSDSNKNDKLKTNDSHQNKLNKNNIPLIMYGEAVEAGKDFWSLGFEEIKNSTSFSTVILHCKNDFSENISLYEVRKNNKNGIIYFLFEGTITRDLMIAYAYDPVRKVFLFKFRIPLS